jgi:hypothetical protein
MTKAKANYQVQSQNIYGKPQYLITTPGKTPLSAGPKSTLFSSQSRSRRPKMIFDKIRPNLK